MNETYDFMGLAASRYSVRKFLGKPVEQEIIDKLLEAGMLAPTACNFQPQRILVINTAESIAKLRICTECHYNAPAALLICYDENSCCKRGYDGKLSGEIDASIVITHIMLEAHALGIGATWVMYFIPEAVKKEFCIPKNFEPVALLVIGYPAPDAVPSPSHTEKKPMESIVSYDKFSEAK